MATPPNVILVTLDALRADHLSSQGYDRETSPFLEELTDEAVQFRAAYSASSHTREAVPSLLTGRYPDNAVDGGYRRDADTVASLLREEGYATAGFHSNPFVSRAYGFDQGFDRFDDDLYLGQNKLVALAQRALDKLRNRHYARAYEISDRSFDWLDSLADEPFFLWNHYMDPHGPYEAPAEYQRRFHGETVPDRTAQKLYQRAIDDPESITDEEQNRLIDLYDAEIAYTDDQLRQFFDGLRERGLFADSLLIVTADHGDAFDEHGYYEHPRYLHEELVHVPLVLSMPGTDAAVVEAPVSTLDVVATIRAVTGASGPAVPGRDLREVAANPDAFADRAVISQARGEDDDAHCRRFAARSGSATVFAEYDTESGGTSFGGDTEADEVVAELRDHIDSHGGDQYGTVDDSSDEDVDDEIEDRLSALGYK